MGDVQEAGKSHLWENLNVRPVRANSICVPDREAEDVAAVLVRGPEEMTLSVEGADIHRDETVKASKVQRTEAPVALAASPSGSKFVEVS